jgi:acylphosphatase
MTASQARLRIFIKGKVQGVFYRQTAQEEATRLGLKGFVKNLPNGDVEAVAEGAEPELEAFVTWCRRGPPMARVSDVQVQREAVSEEFSTFRVER